jgi:hypothetical protein
MGGFMRDRKNGENPQDFRGKPVISKCYMLECAFNGAGLCHAAAITVGDYHPKCDKYSSSNKKSGVIFSSGSVGTCKVTRCAYNRSMLCTAGSIVISRHQDHADCGMFREVSAQ